MGFNCYFLYFPSEDVTIILLNNFLDEQHPTVLPVQDITAILFNKPYELYHEIKEGKVEDAILSNYVGTYSLSTAPKRTIIVSLNNGYLQGNLSATILEFAFQDNQNFQFKNVPGAKGTFSVENGKVFNGIK